MHFKGKVIASIFALAVFFIFSSAALAQSNIGMMHMPVAKSVGQASGATTTSFFMRSGSPSAAYVDVDSQANNATKLQALIYYKNPGDSVYTTSSCWHRGLGFHQCNVSVASGSSTRQVSYFLGAIASTSPDVSTYMPSGTVNGASSSPFTVNVQNTALGSSSISGRTVFAQSLNVAVNTSATTTIPVTSNPASYTNQSAGQMSAGDYVYINGSTTVAQIVTTTANAIVVDTVMSLTANTQLNKVISGVWIFAEGTPFFTTSSANGSFSVNGLIANGSYKLVAFKNGMCDVSPPPFYGGATNNNIFITAGCGGGGGGGGGGQMEDFRAVWTAPNENMMNAPRDITFNQSDMSLTRSPILIGLSQTASSTTITTSTVMLKKVVSGQMQTVTGTIVHYYNPNNASTFCTQNSMAGACLGPEAKIILYSSTPLTADSQYIVEITSGVLSANGNPLQGNRQAGGHGFMFTTSPDMSGMGQQQYGGGGAYMPPFVTGMMPSNGSFGVSLNSSILVMFSEPMDSSSINSANFKLCKVTNPFTTSEGADCAISANVSLDNNTKKTVTIDPTSNLIASSHYRVKVLGAARSASGITIAAPDQPTNEVFKGDLDTGLAIDVGSPTILGNNLMKYYSNSSYTNVPVSYVYEVNFSEGMNQSTISKSSVTMKINGGTTNVNGNVEYDPFANKTRFVPSEVLQSNAIYVFTVATSVQDLAGNALDGDTASSGIQTYTLTFSTVTSDDTAAPKLSELNADNYLLEVRFNEPMVAVMLSDSKWASSTLNISNYTIKYGPSGVNFGSNCASGTAADVSGAKINYDPGVIAVKIENIKANGGASLPVGNTVCVYARNVIDLSNNVIDSSNDTQIATMADHQTTFGVFGGGGMMMGPPSSAGGQMGPMNGTQKPEDMGMMPMAARPMNSMANLSTLYFFDVPATKALEDGALVVFDFQKQGFNVGSAVPDPYSPMRNDWNGPGQCRVRLDSAYDSDGIAVDSTLETVTLKLDIDDGVGGACAPNANEFYHFDVSSITNAQANTTGYTVKITTKNASGANLESNTTMPFNITQAGSRAISIGVLAVASSTNANINVATSTVKIMLGSPMTGPMEGTITYNGSSRIATTTFSGLVDGDYFVFTKPSFDLIVCANVGCSATTSKTFTGVTMPDPIRVSSGTTTRTFTLSPQDTASSTLVEVYLKGNFGSSDVDIFGGSPNGFVKKKVTAPGNLTNFTAYNLYLPSNGNWRVGLGPAMPEGPMFAGPPPMPDWMPPADMMVTASTSGGTSQCIENSVTANDCKIYFTINDASSQIVGYVKDSSGNVIADAGVDAFKVAGFGMPSHAQTDTNGKFILKVALSGGTAAETYGISVYKPGFPSSPQKTVVVTQNNTNPAGAADVLVDGNSTANVYLDGSVAVTTASPLVIYMTKGGYTISGKVYEDTGSDAKTVANAPVWASNSQTSEFIPSGTDSSGYYVLYVKPGTWKVSARTSQLGDLPPTTVTITNASQTVNLRPSSSKSSLLTISGNTGTGNSKLTGAQVWLEGTTNSSQRYENRTMSDSNAEYSLIAPAGTYRLHARHPDFGEYALVNLGAIVASTTQNLTPPASSAYTILSFNFINALSSSTRSFIDVFDPDNNLHNSVEISAISSNTSTETLKIVNSGGRSYHIKAHIPGFGELDPTNTSGYDSTTHKVTIADGTASKLITFTLPSSSNQIVVSGNVTSTAGAVSDAFVWIGNMNTGFHFNSQTDSSGNYSMRVPAGTYRMGVDRPGYGGVSPTDVDLSTSTVQNFVLVSNSNYIIGKITSDGTTAVANAWVWADKVVSATNQASAGGWAGAQADSTGNYSLSIGSGYWVVRSRADGYQETKYSLIVDSSTNPTANITLVAVSNYIAKEPKQQSIIPSQGGVFDDSSGDTKVKVVIPSNFDDDQNQGTLMVRETTSVPKTSAKAPVGGKGKEISLYDSNNVPLKGSSATSSTAASTNKIDLEIGYSESEVTAAGYTEDQLTLGYWDETNKQWVAVDAVVDTVNNVIRASTAHFSVFAPLLPTGSNSPSTPGTPSGTVSGTSITLSWASSSDDVQTNGYEVYRSTTSGGTYSNLSGDSDATGIFDSSKLVGSCSGGVCTWTDSAGSAGNTYYYKVAAFDNDGNNSTSSSASSGITIPSANTAQAVVGGGGGGSEVEPPKLSAPYTTNGEVTATAAVGGKTEIATTENIRASVDIPAAALSANATITITPVPKVVAAVAMVLNSLPGGSFMVGNNVFNYIAKAGGNNVSTFSKPVTLTFIYTDAQAAGLNESTLRISFWDSTNSVWVSLPSSVNTMSNVVTATSTHFTYFALLGEKGIGVQVQKPQQPQQQVVKTISQMGIAELRAEIVRIATLIAQLQSDLMKILAETGGKLKAMLKVSLKYGGNNNDIKILQQWLAKDKDIYPEGIISGWFGPATKRAVIRFQEKYTDEILAPSGLTQGNGIVGPATRAKLNALFGSE